MVPITCIKRGRIAKNVLVKSLGVFSKYFLTLPFLRVGRRVLRRNEKLNNIVKVAT